jgi:hypothetical protein
MPSILEKIPTMKIRDTVILWRNALGVLNEPARAAQHPLAQSVIDAVQAEWRRRRRYRNPADEIFAWPSTEANPGGGNLKTDGWEKEGVLKFMGYQVGNDGEPQSIRERILSQVFSGPLPPVFPESYLDEWGEPETAIRLQKMAEAIAAFTRNAKRRRDSRMHNSIRDWEKDLEFLYYEYYVTKFYFAWPTTDVAKG